MPAAAIAAKSLRSCHGIYHSVACHRLTPKESSTNLHNGSQTNHLRTHASIVQPPCPIAAKQTPPRIAHTQEDKEVPKTEQPNCQSQMPWSAPCPSPMPPLTITPSTPQTTPRYQTHNLNSTNLAQTTEVEDATCKKKLHSGATMSTNKAKLNSRSLLNLAATGTHAVLVSVSAL